MGQSKRPTDPDIEERSHWIETGFSKPFNPYPERWVPARTIWSNRREIWCYWNPQAEVWMPVVQNDLVMCRYRSGDELLLSMLKVNDHTITVIQESADDH